MLVFQREEVKLESLDRRNTSWILEICKCVTFDDSDNRMKDMSKHTCEVQDRQAQTYFDRNHGRETSPRSTSLACDISFAQGI
jgi:hypothetical protein